MSDDKPMRCAECDCERGGIECNWIMPGPGAIPEMSRLITALRAQVAALAAERNHFREIVNDFKTLARLPPERQPDERP